MFMRFHISWFLCQPKLVIGQNAFRESVVINSFLIYSTALNDMRCDQKGNLSNSNLSKCEMEIPSSWTDTCYWSKCVEMIEIVYLSFTKKKKKLYILVWWKVPFISIDVVKLMQGRYNWRSINEGFLHRLGAIKTLKYEEI